MATVGSPSIEHPGYWWYRARADLLRVALEKYVAGHGRLLDVGSADGPSVDWLRDRGHRVRSRSAAKNGNVPVKMYDARRTSMPWARTAASARGRV